MSIWVHFDFEIPTYEPTTNWLTTDKTDISILCVTGLKLQVSINEVTELSRGRLSELTLARLPWLA